MLSIDRKLILKKEVRHYGGNTLSRPFVSQDGDLIDLIE
jgi:hypothetical protein